MREKKCTGLSYQHQFGDTKRKRNLWVIFLLSRYKNERMERNKCERDDIDRVLDRLFPHTATFRGCGESCSLVPKGPIDPRDLRTLRGIVAKYQGTQQKGRRKELEALLRG